MSNFIIVISPYILFKVRFLTFLVKMTALTNRLSSGLNPKELDLLVWVCFLTSDITSSITSFISKAIGHERNLYYISFSFQYWTPNKENHSPSSYAFAATFAAICAEIFLMLENGGYISPFSKFSWVTCPARASAVPTKHGHWKTQWEAESTKIWRSWTSVFFRSWTF